jgi:hypothetical protein
MEVGLLKVTLENESVTAEITAVDLKNPWADEKEEVDAPMMVLDCTTPEH